jgi:hypothetical protein
VREGLEPPDAVIAVGAQRGPAARGEAAGGIVGELDDRIAAILADPDRPAEPVRLIGEEAGVGVDYADPVAVGIVEVADRPGDVGSATLIIYYSQLWRIYIDRTSDGDAAILLPDIARYL